jgi:hypothetical protein
MSVIATNRELPSVLSSFHRRFSYRRLGDFHGGISSGRELRFGVPPIENHFA